MAEAIGVKNLKIQIENLRTEAREAAASVSSAYLKEKEIKSNLEFLNGELEFKKQEWNKLQEKIEKETNELENKKLSLKKDESDHVKNLSIIKENAKIEQKNLNRLNDWILKAEDLKKKKELEIDSLDRTISKKEKIVEEIFSLENEIQSCKKEIDLLKLEKATIIRETEEELFFLKESLKKVEIETNHLKKEAEYAEIKKNKIDSELALKISDIREYHQRVKDAWNLVFPGRNMPML